jgi:hypothetical protein
MKIFIELPDLIFQEVKMRADQQGVALHDLLVSSIVAGMNAPRATGASPMMPVPLPYFRQPNGTVVPARSNAELHAILENDDIADHRQASATSQLAFDMDS